MDTDYIRKSGVRVIIAVVVTLFIILASGMGWLRPLYSGANLIARPIEYWVIQGIRGSENFIATIAEIGSLRSKNADLVIENAKLAGELGAYKEIEKENEILRSQLGIELTKDWELKKVRILGIDEYGMSEHVVIDGGSDDDIEVGDVVILGDLLIGEVRDVFQSTARVRLVSNQKSNIVAIDQKTRAKGLVHGSLEGIVMEGVLENEELNVGDTVITWEDDIPGGLVVGTISEVETDPTSSTKKAFLETGFSLEDVQYVFVVLNF